jgi:hypothetical protein
MAAIVCCCLLAGCGQRLSQTPTAKRPSANPAAATTAARSGDQNGQRDSQTQTSQRSKPNKNKNDRTKWHEPDENWLPPLGAAGSGSFVAATSNWSGGAAFTETQALDRIERELADATKLRPTLVVWLLDQSAAAGTLRRVVAGSAVQIPSRLAGSSEAKDDAKKHTLLTAIVAFGAKVSFLTPEPVDDAAKLPSGESIGEEPQPSTQAFAALAEAAKKFAPYRMRGHEVIFVLVGRSATADEANFQAAVSTLGKAAIPVFGIGPAAPFGRLADSLTADIRPPDTNAGLESLHAERINLFFPDNQGDAELTDSGYGPFHLERIARATEGRFLRIRRGGSPGWATDDGGEIKPELLRKYAPDYVSEDDYKKLLAANRACQALHDAAKLPPATVLIAPALDFQKEEQAAMNRTLSMAQRAAAANQQNLDRLHQTLAAGEADREKLTSPRWQAGFDLALGRACAARARNNGYNHMLAVLKDGKTFANQTSRIWSLKPADGIADSSELDRTAKKAKTLLERVVKEHPGTPWAAMAARELEAKCGWEWTEK